MVIVATIKEAVVAMPIALEDIDSLASDIIVTKSDTELMYVIKRTQEMKRQMLQLKMSITKTRWRRGTHL